MEILRRKSEANRLRSNRIPLVFAATLLAGGCTIDSYLNDPTDVQCDGRRTLSELSGDGVATFIVHGKGKNNGVITVRKEDGAVSLHADGIMSGPAAELDEDGYTIPVALRNGPELSAFVAGGAWIIDVRNKSVVIQGSCDGI